MDLVEIKQKERLSRADAAARLRDVAEQLARGNEVELGRDETRVRARVPDEVELKVELDIDDEGTELELELSWDAPSS